MMVEAGAQEVSEAEMLEAILEGHEVIKEICKFTNEITSEIGKEKAEYEVFKADEEIVSQVKEYGKDLLVDAIRQKDKIVRVEKTEAAKEDIREHFKDLMEEELFLTYTFLLQGVHFYQLPSKF